MRISRASTLLASAGLVAGPTAPGSFAAAAVPAAPDITADDGERSWYSWTGELGMPVTGSRTWDSGEHVFELTDPYGTGDGSAVEVRVREAEYNGPTLLLQATDGEPLTAGRTYVDNSTGLDPDRSDTGAISLGGGGYGCNLDSGRFTVHDIDIAAGRLDATFVHVCDGPWPVYTWGQAALAQPADAAAYVTPSRLDLGPQVPGEVDRPTALTVTNDQTVPLTVRGAQVIGGDGEIGLARSTCSEVPPGGWCRLELRGQPQTDGRTDATVRIDTDAGPLDVAVSVVGDSSLAEEFPSSQRTDGRSDPASRWPSEIGPGTPQLTEDLEGLTYYALRGEEGSGRTEDVDYQRRTGPLPDTWEYWTAGDFGAGVALKTPYASVRIRGTTDRPFTAGATYEVPGPGEAYDVPEVRYMFDHWSCDDTAGDFTVHQVEYDRYGIVSRFAADGSVRCGDNTGATRFAFGKNAVGDFIPAPPPPPPPPPRDPATRLRLAPTPETVPSGTVVRLAGRLVSKQTGRPVRGARVAVFGCQGRRVCDTSRIAVLRTNDRGRFGMRLRVEKRLYVKAVFRGTQRWERSFSNVRRTKVRGTRR